MFRQSSANRDGEGEDDRKERFHSTKYRRDCAADRRFEFHKRSQLFIRTHDEALSIVAVRVRETLDGQKKTEIPRIQGSRTGRRLRERRSSTKASRQLNSIQPFGPSLP